MIDTKAVIVVRDDLLVWQKLNVAAFLSSGIIGPGAELIGERYMDGSGQSYRALMSHPIIVLTTDRAGLTKIHGRASSRGVDMAIYINEMFSTGNDVANRAVVAEFETDALDLVGIAIHTDRSVADKIVKGARMHP